MPLDHAKRNQHKPIREFIVASIELGLIPMGAVAPRDELERWVKYYWHLGFSDPKIADHVLDHFDREEFGCR